MPIPVDPPPDPRQVALDRVWAFVRSKHRPTLAELKAALQGTHPTR